jgi:hypothetical protein
MNTQFTDMDEERSFRPDVDATKLWAGGIATAVVAGLVALAGVLAFRWLFGVPILAPNGAGAYGGVHTTEYVLTAVLVAVIATGLIQLLLLTTPRPIGFFGWIIGLATLVAMLFPFSTAAPLSQKFATGAVNLFIGIAIGSLLIGVTNRST